MKISLDKIEKLKGSTRKAKRVGRGYGSGKGGHNSTYGTKGQKARQGRKPHAWFEGGQTPLVRRLPYTHGFTPKDSYKILILNLATIEKIAKDIKKSDIDISDIKKIDFGSYDFIKILGRGELKSKLDLKGFWYSEKAKQKIEKVGGSVK